MLSEAEGDEYTSPRLCRFFSDSRTLMSSHAVRTSFCDIEMSLAKERDATKEGEAGSAGHS
jgi:hypothetical protein